jgi:hypothetical protein
MHCSAEYEKGIYFQLQITLEKPVRQQCNLCVCTSTATIKPRDSLIIPFPAYLQIATLCNPIPMIAMQNVKYLPESPTFTPQHMLTDLIF